MIGSIPCTLEFPSLIKPDAKDAAGLVRWGRLLSNRELIAHSSVELRLGVLDMRLTFST